jgi:hypothetical protein
MAKTDTGTGPASAASDAGVSSHHPDYDDRIDEWLLMRHAMREKSIKQEGERYLPMPEGFKTQPDKGVGMYSAYRTRAQFPPILGPTVMGHAGLIHRMEAQIEMPDSMEFIWERATREGMPLEALHRKITFELLGTGRIALLVDAPREGDPDANPYIAEYKAEELINWSEDRDMFVLDESGYVRNGFTWEYEHKWRVLELNEKGVYQQRVFYGDNMVEDEPVIPQVLGGKPLEEIPFVVVGPQNLEVTPDEPPLLGVARSAVNIYQLSADYRYQLWSTGQETLFVYNMEKPDVIGAGVIVSVEEVSKELHPPKAEYVGPKGIGIGAHKEAIADEYQIAARAGARLFDNRTEGGGVESGEAKRMRYASENATLTSISQTAASALERVLRYIALFLGEDPEKVIVKPNLTFVDTKMTPQEAKDLVEVWQKQGISYQTLYENLQRGEIASAERDFEEELELIKEEEEKMDPGLDGIDPVTGRPLTAPGQQVPPAPPPAPQKVPANG